MTPHLELPHFDLHLPPSVTTAPRTLMSQFGGQPDVSLPHPHLPMPHINFHLPHLHIALPHVNVPGMDRFVPRSRRQERWLTVDEGLRIMAAVAMGAAAMYLLDPQQGRRRRQMIASRTAAVAQQLLGDMSNRGRGASEFIGGKLQGLIHVRAAEQLLDDASLQRRVERILSHEPGMPSVSVSCEHGVIVLRGFVDDLAQAQAIEQRARSVAGVQEVHSLLTGYRVPSTEHRVPGPSSD
ncbi:MAG: BON domain-containing protein [Chloroflexi bacterium]|nr:BON domain-containing protein [Chloroflexota bacterium]